MALTATITVAIKKDVVEKLDILGCVTVSVSPNRPNIYYEVHCRTDIDTDLGHIVESLRVNSNTAERVIIYCRSLNVCADLYEHFHDALQDRLYYPPTAEHISDNRLFGMFHAHTPQHNKDVILESLQSANGTVRVVFATVALGMGVNMAGVNKIVHYGAPHSIEDYMQESGRAGRSGDPAISVVYWKPADAPLRRVLKTSRDKEIAAVRKYLENVTSCRRVILLSYFDQGLVDTLPPQDNHSCCDICRKRL